MKISFSHEFLLKGYSRKDVVQVPATLARLLNCEWAYLTRQSLDTETREIPSTGKIQFVCGEHSSLNQRLLEQGEETKLVFTKRFSISSGWRAAADSELYVTMFINLRTAISATAFRVGRMLRRKKGFVYVKADLGFQERQRLELDFQKYLLKRLRMRLEELWLSVVVDVISVETEDGQRWLKKHFRRLSERIIVVRNCTDSRSTSCDDAGSRERKIIAVSRLGAHEKATDILLPAFREFHKQCNEWRLQLIGPGSDKLTALLADYEDLILSGKIQHVGYIKDPAELCRLYRSAAIFVNPSRFEGFPLVLIEAIREGCVPICTPVFPVEEVLGIYADELVVPVENVNALANAMARLARSEGKWDSIRAYLQSRTATWNWQAQLEPLVVKFKRAMQEDSSLQSVKF